jgi:small-conductance mechanosensitive channel
VGEGISFLWSGTGLGPVLGRIESVTGVPRPVLGAVLILLAGWVTAVVARLLVRRLGERLQTLLPSAEHRDLDEALGSRRTSGVAARAAYWAVLLIFAMAATETLGLPIITTWLSGVTTYLPRLLVALLVLLAGVVVARVARRALRRAAASAGAAHADRLGRIAYLTVIAVTILVATEELGLDVRFVTTGLLVALGALLATASLAFGLGSAPVVGNILAGHYVRKLYEEGQVVRIDGVEGRIVRLTATAVVLESAEGEVAVPAREFTRQRSVLVSRSAAP